MISNLIVSKSNATAHLKKNPASKESAKRVKVQKCVMYRQAL